MVRPHCQMAISFPNSKRSGSARCALLLLDSDSSTVLHGDWTMWLYLTLLPYINAVWSAKGSLSPRQR